jgi:hypothetical protein
MREEVSGKSSGNAWAYKIESLEEAGARVGNGGTGRFAEVSKAGKVAGLTVS